jgi:hypothetical protein
LVIQWSQSSSQGVTERVMKSVRGGTEIIDLLMRRCRVGSAMILLLLLQLLASTTNADVYVSNGYTIETCTVALAQCPDLASALDIVSDYR